MSGLQAQLKDMQVSGVVAVVGLMTGENVSGKVVHTSDDFVLIQPQPQGTWRPKAILITYWGIARIDQTDLPDREAS